MNIYTIFTNQSWKWYPFVSEDTMDHSCELAIGNNTEKPKTPKSQFLHW